MKLETITPLLIGAWRREVKKQGPQSQLLISETKALSTKVSSIETGLMSCPKDWIQSGKASPDFLLYHWPLFYEQAGSLIGEVPHPLGKVLSIGSPYAPFAIQAALKGAEEVTYLDLDPESLRIGGELSGKIGMALKGRLWRGLPHLPKEGRFNTIVVDYALRNLKSLEERLIWVEKMIDLLEPNGSLVIVDLSEGEVNSSMLEMRDCFVERGLCIKAPCIWKGACPARLSKSPCYAQRPLDRTFVMKELQQAASIKQNSLKFSYLIIGKENPPLSQVSYRVVSPPFKEDGGEHFVLCGTDGKKRVHVRGNEVPKGAKALSFLKRGEVISFEGELRSGQDIYVGPDTKAKIVSAIGKPVSRDE